MLYKICELYTFLEKEGFTKEAIAMKALVPSDIHDAADAAKIDWDDNDSFMNATESLTGKRHLDDMDPNELQEVLVAIDFYKEINKGLTKEAKDPKKGTGKKPKGSGRRLYTDENPKDTVSVKFRTVEDIRETLSKKSFKSKSHARQSQIINLIHQRVRAAYRNAKDPKTKARLGRAFKYIKNKKKKSKEKTKRLKESKG